ncbi:MAG: helix-turn-helix domain-containing protein [Kineosporiaceae bacterium]
MDADGEGAAPGVPGPRAPGSGASRARGGVGRGADGDRRARVLDAVRSAAQPLTIEEVAAEVGLATSTARFHLDHLVDSGAVQADRDPTPRPGRPRLRYTAAPVVAVDAQAAMLRLAQLLAATFDAAGAEAAEQAGRAWAHRVLQEHVGAGGRLPEPGDPAAVDDLLALAERVLHDEGFSPRAREDGRTLELHHCPYLAVAADHPRTVCGMHLGLLRGLSEGFGVEASWLLVPELDGDAPCLVALRERQAAPGAQPGGS